MSKNGWLLRIAGFWLVFHYAFTGAGLSDQERHVRILCGVALYGVGLFWFVRDGRRPKHE